MTHEDYMRRAIELAKRGVGFTNPNPMVGAVIVKDGRIIGEGWHRRCGELHAERNAFAALTESAAGADIYVTLEPCCHYGRTPPCTEAIIEHGIRRVFIGSRDPNPLVAGKGAALLRGHGIEVTEDLIREECDEINPVFFKYITTKKPYVALKYAMTLDGKIATRTGESKWITGPEARSHVHELRGRYAAILAGIGTVLADDPMLNCRIDGAHQPLRIILDSTLRIPEASALVRSAKDYPLLVVCSAESEKADRLRQAGVRVEVLPGENGRTDPAALMSLLGEEKIDSVLVEGGGEIHEAFLAAGLGDHVYAYIAPKLFGGRTARSPVGGSGIEHPAQCAMLENAKLTTLGSDLLLEYDITKGFDLCSRE